MNAEIRNANFLDIFRMGLLASQRKLALEKLGDRSLYLGLSDLAKYQECPRKAIADKISEATSDLGALLTLGRGHWFEQGASDSFSALGLNQMRQVEITSNYQNALIKGHLDIVLVWEIPYPAVRILEIKSMETLPVEPYKSQQWQISSQTALLKKHWNEKAFSVNGKGKQSFPELCKSWLGLSLPEKMEACSVEGWLLCLSMTESRAFGPYTPDAEFVEELNIKAFTMRQQLAQCKAGKITLNVIPHAEGFYPLCSWCQVNKDCPKFQTESIQKELEPVLSNLAQLKADRSVLDSEIREIETNLKLIYQNSGNDGWISANGHRFRISQCKGRKMLDKGLLEAELENLFHVWKIEGDSVKAFLSRCEKESAPSSRLLIQPVNQEN